MASEPWRADNYLWRRDFENGIVLVNPTDLLQFIELGETVRRIRGQLDRDFNTGEPLDEVSLAPKSGIILLRDSVLGNLENCKQGVSIN